MGMHQCYQKGLELAGNNIRNEGELKANGSGHLFANAKINGVELTCLINSNNVVVKAKHNGATDVTRILLDQLCNVLMGRSIQEGHDHGVLRLEHLLRDMTQEAPIKGIITPENADPAFKVPQTLIRTLYKNFVRDNNIEEKKNFWDDSPIAEWSNLPHGERQKKAELAILKACGELGLQQKDISVVGIRDNVRIVMSFTQDSSKPNIGDHIIRLERRLKATVDPRLEIQLESLVDKNKRIERTARSKENLANPDGKFKH